MRIIDLKYAVRAIACALILALVVLPASAASTFKQGVGLSATQATAALSAMSGGYVKIYSGTQPANPATALSGNTELVSLQFNTTAGTIATTSGTGSVITASFVASTVTVEASGTATFYRVTDKNGNVLWDSSVGQGTSGCGYDACLGAVALGAGAQFGPFTLTLTIGPSY